MRLVLNIQGVSSNTPLYPLRRQSWNTLPGLLRLNEKRLQEKRRDKMRSGYKRIDEMRSGYKRREEMK